MREVNIMPNHIHHLYHPTIIDKSIRSNKPKVDSTEDFKQILAKQQSIKLSKHAKERMVERNIHLTNKQWNTLSDKLKEAKQKGIRESVVILKGAALLVNAENQTVITAMNHEEASDKIFTNINGAILLNN